MQEPEAIGYSNQELGVQKGRGEKTHFRAEKPIKKQNKQSQGHMVVL